VFGRARGEAGPAESAPGRLRGDGREKTEETRVARLLGRSDPVDAVVEPGRDGPLVPALRAAAVGRRDSATTFEPHVRAVVVAVGAVEAIDLEGAALHAHDGAVAGDVLEEAERPRFAVVAALRAAEGVQVFGQRGAHARTLHAIPRMSAGSSHRWPQNRLSGSGRKAQHSRRGRAGWSCMVGASGPASSSTSP